MLGQTENQERDASPEQPLPGAAGATRYQRKPGASPALKEHLRRIDPTYKAAQAARGPAARPASPAGADAPFPPADES